MHLILSILFLLWGSSAYSMDFLKEFQVIDDKLQFSNKPLPTSKYFIDTNLHLNYDYKVIQKDIEVLNANPTDEEINSFIDRYSGKIKNIKANGKIGIQLLEEKTYDFYWTTYFQASYDYSLSALLYEKTLSFGDIESLFPQNLPVELKYFLRTLSPGTDIIDACRKSETLSSESLYLCMQYPRNTYFIPAPDQQVPNFVFLSKQDFKVGFFNHFKNGKFFGSFHLYGLRREDFYRLITPDQLNSVSPDLFSDNVANQEDTLQLDYSFGYYGKIHQFMVAFDELKLLTLKKRKEESKELFYPYASLVKVQASSKYPLGDCYIGHFVGFQSRNYSLLDGAYFGINSGVNWKKDLIDFEVMYDSYFLSLTPRLVLSKFSIEYGYKMPAHHKIKNLELAPIQSINLGLSF